VYFNFFSVYKAWFNLSGAKNHHSYIMNIFVAIFVWAVMSGCYNIYRIEVFAFNSFTGYVTRLIQLVPLVEQELLIPAEHLSSPRVLVEFVLLDLYTKVTSSCSTSTTHRVTVKRLEETSSDMKISIRK
jgi:hypothetical protein